MSRRSGLLALLGAIGLALAMTSSAFAYTGQVPKTITVTPSHGTFTCGHYYWVRATVLDQNGNPIKHLTVTWSFTPVVSSSDKFKHLSSKTNKHGVAKVRVKLSCKSLNDRVITASTDGISGSAVVHVKKRHHHHDDDKGDKDKHDSNTVATGTTVVARAGVIIDAYSLPNTSTLPAATSSDQAPLPAIPAIVAFLAVVAILGRRFVLSRR